MHSHAAGGIDNAPRMKYPGLHIASGREPRAKFAPCIQTANWGRWGKINPGCPPHPSVGVGSGNRRIFTYLAGGDTKVGPVWRKLETIILPVFDCLVPGARYVPGKKMHYDDTKLSRIRGAAKSVPAGVS